MRIFCSNDKKTNKQEGYDVYIDLKCPSDIGFNFWDKDIEFVSKFSSLAIDLLYISIFIFTMDRRELRKNQSDNWTRYFELNIPVSDVKFWNQQKELLHKMISFLSGDVWKFSFREKEIYDEERIYKKNINKKVEIKEYDTVCMLSGGLDSYIGAIDLLERRQNKILFVSHYGGGKGTKEYQDMVFESLKKYYILDEKDYIQFYVTCKKGLEDTTRTRSFMFFSHAIALASAFNVNTKMYIPENGFISLNIPLSGARFGSSSTRTTHPYYIKLLECLIKNMELQMTIINPYQLKTKGEMILECKNRGLLMANYINTMSCSHPDVGRYNKESKTRHCGSCIPCIIRRAAIFKGFGLDKTDIRDLKINKTEIAQLNRNAFLQKINTFNSNTSILEIQKSGIIDKNINELANMYCRGIKEIKDFFKKIRIEF